MKSTEELPFSQPQRFDVYSGRFFNWRMIKNFEGVIVLKRFMNPDRELFINTVKREMSEYNGRFFYAYDVDTPNNPLAVAMSSVYLKKLYIRFYWHLHISHLKVVLQTVIQENKKLGCDQVVFPLVKGFVGIGSNELGTVHPDRYRPDIRWYTTSYENFSQMLVGTWNVR